MNDAISMPREVGLRICCPRVACGSPLVRKTRRYGRYCTIECKECGHQWKELQDDSVVHGLIVLAPPATKASARV